MPRQVNLKIRKPRATTTSFPIAFIYAFRRKTAIAEEKKWKKLKPSTSGAIITTGSR
jgi:hypothetical protein